MPFDALWLLSKATRRDEDLMPPLTTPLQRDPRPPGHSRIECSCGRVISSCRCTGPHEVQIRQHPACGVEPPLYNPLSTESPINVGLLPGRKTPALYVTRGGAIEVLAYFRSEAAMETFLSFHPRVNRRPSET